MPSTNRIISAEELGSFRRFALGALADGPASPLKRSAVLHRDGQAPMPTLDEAQRRQYMAQQRQRQLSESFDAGYRDGVEAGREAAARQQEQAEVAIGATLRQRVEALTASLEAELEAFHSTGADRLLDLAIEIARQIVRHTIAQDRETVISVVQEALTQLHDESTPAKLSLNPIDVPIVETQLAALLTRRQIELVPNPAISPGGCQLVSVLAEVDATVQTRWRRSLAVLGRSPESEPLVRQDD